ncbi:unnamed protein product [Rotaria sp. Silwood1]|nr:unnamed protein product [Rotaria sp. Silwood1]
MNDHQNKPNLYEREKEPSDDNLQKPDIYIKYLPFYESIKRHGFESFDEIRENLSRTIQLGELHPNFSVWSNALKRFIDIYGFYFTKVHHLKLINFYISILSISDLNYSHAKICFDMLFQLLQKTCLITRNELTIDWRILYRWAKLILYNHDEQYSLVKLPKFIDISFNCCIECCSSYFSVTATQEILDQFRPYLCPYDSAFSDAMKMFDSFLPIDLPPGLHNQGFKLWLTELFNIWDCIYNNTDSDLWEMYLVHLFSNLAWYNIGYIDWEPWLAQIFTRILNRFSLPIGKNNESQNSSPYMMTDVARWFVAMIGNRSSCLQYMHELFIAIKTFYYPSNTGEFQKYLIELILQLTEQFVERVRLERKIRPHWNFKPHESYRLTEQNITNFVNCIKDYVFMSICNQDYIEDAAKACQYLSILRPELIIPPIMDRLFLSIDNMIEPDRFTLIMKCLPGIVRQIVRQTTTYSEGQIYVLPLLMSILPGIDSNDSEKVEVTFEVLDAILKLVQCIDCSSAVSIRTDLTEIEKQVCLSTTQFEDFVTDFLNRIFQMISRRSTETYDAAVSNNEISQNNRIIEIKLISIMSNIVQQCSSKIFQIIRDKITEFISGSIFSYKVQKLIANHRGDIELIWYLTLFSELVHARSGTLLIYKQMIMSIFHKCIRIIHKDSYEIIAKAAKNLLQSLTQLYPIRHGLSNKNSNELFTEFLPIRAWGQHIDFDQFQIHFHFPNINEINFACEFVNTFIYDEFQLLNEKYLQLSNDERLRSLRIIQYIAMGCLHMVPSIESNLITDLVPSVVPYGSKYQFRYPIYSKEPKFRDNLRMRILIDIGNLLDILIKNHSDDVASIKTAINIYTLSSTYYGSTPNDIQALCIIINSDENLFKSRLGGKRENPRFLIVKQIILHIKIFELYCLETFTEIDKQIVLKLFELSINRYSEIRCNAQMKLLSIFNQFSFSYQIIVDCIYELLNKQDEVDHDQIKGCLYILLGDDSFFLPIQHSWTMMEKLWPSIIRLSHTNKFSITNIINEISSQILEEFHTLPLIENINKISIDSAVSLWQQLNPNEMKIDEEYQRNNIQSYNNLMEILNALINDDKSTWKQQKISMSFMCLLLQKQISIPLSCIRTFVNYLIHDNMELRKYAIMGMIALCRLQKPPRFYIQKTLDEILGYENSNIIDEKCYPGDRDDNLWVTISNYKIPDTQIEWEKICFLDKSFHGYYKWPKIIEYCLNKRIRYIQDTMPEQVAILYDRFIDKKFIVQLIQSVILEEDDGDINFSKNRFLMYKGLFRNFGNIFMKNFMEQLYVLIHETISEKQEGCHRTAAEIVAGVIRGSKHWTLEMLDELWMKLIPFLNEVWKNFTHENRYYWGLCFKYGMENQDPRRMYRLIDYICSLITNNHVMETAFDETSRWFLVEELKTFQWRIPSIWCIINNYAKELLDHPFKTVRTILSISISFDIILPNGKSTRHPKINQFIDTICEQLHQAIEVYEKKPIVNNSDQITGIDLETRKALNLIETVIQIQTYLFDWCQQPVKSATIRLFPHICTSSKWHVRLAAIEFVQNLIFCNLFNSRPYAKRLNKLLLKCLFDEQLEVRTIASMTLSGFYQCGYIELTVKDLNYFDVMSKTNYFTKTNDKKVISGENIIKRHGGILGLCAIVLSSSYDISMYVPEALVLLCEHLHDPDLIQVYNIKFIIMLAYIRYI